MMRCTIESKFKRKNKKKLWQIYLECFKNNPTACAQNQQCYNRKSFYRALKDKDYYKFILRQQKTGEIIGCGLLTDNLKKAKVAYINPEKFHGIFLESGKDKIIYFTFIGISPSRKQPAAFLILMSSIVKFAFNNHALAAFDFSREKNGSLQKMIAAVAQKLIKQKEISSSGVEYKVVDIQEFGVMKLTP